MKIIALLPLKNDAWILRTCLESLDVIADEVIIFDDGSTDDYGVILKSFPKVVVVKRTAAEVGAINMSEVRRKLLELGRKAGGTHFIWLDADEAFSKNFFNKSKEYIVKLKPGQKLMMKWIFLWKSRDEYRVDGVFKDLYKDFIVCDDPNAVFEDKFLSEARTPGKSDDVIRIAEEDGVVLHFQYLDWRRNQLKQARYRCFELIKGERSAIRINCTYAITLGEKVKTERVPEEWSCGITFPLAGLDGGNWYLKEIFDSFDRYGIKFFEPLQIWHIEELRQEFMKRVGREPKSRVLPRWIVPLNDLKNKLKKKIHSF